MRVRVATPVPHSRLHVPHSVQSVSHGSVLQFLFSVLLDPLSMRVRVETPVPHSRSQVLHSVQFVSHGSVLQFLFSVSVEPLSMRVRVATPVPHSRSHAPHSDHGVALHASTLPILIFKFRNFTGHVSCPGPAKPLQTWTLR